MKCIICQKEFEKKADKQVFCSKKCCDLNYRQTKKGITKVKEHKINCLACNKELLVDNNVRKYCDRKCKNDYKNNLRDTHTMKIRENKICTICNKSYFPTRLNKSYCSKSCKAKEFRKHHIEELKLGMKEWYNSTAGKLWRKAYTSTPEYRIMQKKMYDNNPKLKFIRALRDREYKAITLQQGYKQGHTIELLGADVMTARAHLEAQFTNGMSWENYGKFGWHIDHIIPCASFDLTKLEEQKKCFHYTNLQPLWWYDNLSKCANLNYQCREFDVSKILVEVPHYG